jgi:hypothetical protein
MFNKIKILIQSIYNRVTNKPEAQPLPDEAPFVPKDDLDFSSFSNEDVIAILDSTNLLPLSEIKSEPFLEYEDYEVPYEETEVEKFDREQKELAQRIIKNPTFPYFRRFCHPSGENSIVADFKNEARPFNAQNYNKLFNKYISKDSFLNEEKLPFLQKIWEDALYLKEVFMPLEKMGIEYVLDLTGGAVRDYVLDKHTEIKDLDFMLSIQAEHIGLYSLDKYFSKSQIKALELDSDDTLDSKKIKLVQLCFLAHNEKIEVFSHVKDEKIDEDNGSYYGYNESTKKARLIGVVKNESQRTHYPIDILLTDYTKFEFIDDFDFDICKASFCFVNPHVKKEFPDEPSHLISRFVAENDFWADVHNKMISYNTTDRNQYHINAAFEKHLPRIEAKYPDYKIHIVGKGEHKPYALAKIFSRDLNAELSNQEVIKPQKKLKL